MEDNTKTIQKIFLDSIMTVVREEIQKGRSADVVYATITGVDELGSFYRFTYNGHEYIGHSNLPNFSVGENVYVLFNGSQDENVVLCGENVSDGSFNGNKYVTRVLTQYIISDNSTVVPSDDSANWKTGYETQDSDKGRWVRTVTNYSDGSVEYSTPVYMTSGSNETAQDLSDFKQQYEKDKEALQGKVDSKVNVYYSSEAPVGLKSDNVGDIWVDADNGKSQMWDGSKWIEFTTKVPPELLDQVDGKSTIYSTQPTVPYDKNDVWFNGDDIYVCITTKTEGEFDSADWARKETYAHQSTVDANNEAFQNFKNVTYSKDISDLRQKVTAQEQELTGNVDGTVINTLKTTVSEHEQKFDEIGNTISEKVNSMFTEKDGTTLSTFVDKVNAIKQTADGTQESYTKIQNTLNDNYFTKEESKNLISKTADGIKVEVDKNTEKIGYSVSDVKTYYLQNDGTKPSADDSAWSLTAPERVAGKHIWTHTIVTLNSGTSVDKGIVDITGADGVSPTVSAERTGSGVEITITNSDGTTKTATLNDGAKGDRGPQGKDGRSSYVHFAYAQSDDGTVGFSTSTFAGATYIGVNYNYEEDDPTTPSSYSWSRLKGDTGPQGPQGVKGDTGATGPQGSSSYTHIAYGNVVFYDAVDDVSINGDTLILSYKKTGKNITVANDGSTLIFGDNGDRPFSATATTDGTLKFSYYTVNDFSTTDNSNRGWMGICINETESAPSSPYAYTWTKIVGERGEDGKGIKSTDITYQASSSQTTVPSGAWSASIPTMSVDSPYLWTRTIITYTDNSTSTSYNVSSSSSVVTIIEEQYYSSTSSSSPTGSNWPNQCPAYIDSHWIWTRTALTRNDGSVTYTDPKLATDLNQINAAITSAQSSAADAQKTANSAITNSTTAVAYTAVQYLKTSSQSVPSQSDSGWTENTQSYESNKYIWMRVLYKLKNGNVNYGNPVCLTAGVQNDINTMKQSFYADESGAHVKSGNGGETLVQGDGVHIKVNGAEVANYTASGGSITQLNVDNYFFVGAHRVQKYTLNGETGTAFFWKG